MALIQVQVPYMDNYDHGIGVDFPSGSPMGKVVNGDISGVTHAGGATTNIEIARIHTTSELTTKLGIDAETTGGCGLFRASARFNYVKEAKIQSNSLFMAVTATVTLPIESIDDPTLTDNAAKIVNQPDQFSSRFGNMFVRGIQRGGFFIGVIQINASNSDTSERIAGQLRGSYNLFSAEIKTKFEKLMRDSQSEIRISLYHEGGPINLVPNDLQDPMELYKILGQWLQSFQDNPEKNAVPYSVTLAPIAIANGPIPLNLADIQHAKDILSICANQRNSILDGLNLMNYISQNSSRYDFIAPTTPNDIVKASNGYQADLDIVAAAASLAINDVTQAITPAAYALKIGHSYPQGLPPVPMPTLKKSETSADHFINLIKSGSEFTVTFDQVGNKFDDSGYTGLGDPMGTLQAGRTYKVTYSNGSYTTVGFSEGTGSVITAAYNNANPDAQEISLWGRVFTFDAAGNIFDAAFGIVGTLRF